MIVKTACACGIYMDAVHLWLPLFSPPQVSPYFKQKLQGLYMNSLQDAKRELAYVSIVI